MARRPRSPMRPPHHHAAISYSPPELAEAISAFGRNLLRLLHARGELHDGLFARLSRGGRVDLLDLPHSNPARGFVPLDEVKASTNKATLKRLRALARTPPETPALGDTHFARNFTWLADELAWGRWSAWCCSSRSRWRPRRRS